MHSADCFTSTQPAHSRVARDRLPPSSKPLYLTLSLSPPTFAAQAHPPLFTCVLSRKIIVQSPNSSFILGIPRCLIWATPLKDMLFGLQRAYRSVASTLRYGGRHYHKHYRTKPADRPRNYEEAVLKASPAGRAAAAEAFRRSTARQKEALPLVRRSVPAPGHPAKRTVESVRFVVDGVYAYSNGKRMTTHEGTKTPTPRVTGPSYGTKASVHAARTPVRQRKHSSSPVTEVDPRRAAQDSQRPMEQPSPVVSAVNFSKGSESSSTSQQATKSGGGHQSPPRNESVVSQRSTGGPLESCRSSQADLANAAQSLQPGVHHVSGTSSTITPLSRGNAPNTRPNPSAMSAVRSNYTNIRPKILAPTSSSTARASPSMVQPKVFGNGRSASTVLPPRHKQSLEIPRASPSSKTVTSPSRSNRALAEEHANLQLAAEKLLQMLKGEETRGIE